MKAGMTRNRFSRDGLRAAAGSPGAALSGRPRAEPTEWRVARRARFAPALPDRQRARVTRRIVTISGSLFSAVFAGATVLICLAQPAAAQAPPPGAKADAFGDAL